MFLIVCGEYKSIKRQGPSVSNWDPTGILTRTLGLVAETLEQAAHPQVTFSELYVFYVCVNVMCVCDCECSASTQHHMGMGLI